MVGCMTVSSGGLLWLGLEDAGQRQARGSGNGAVVVFRFRRPVFRAEGCPAAWSTQPARRLAPGW